MMAFMGVMTGNPASIGEGIQAAVEAGIEIAEIIEELMVQMNILFIFAHKTHAVRMFCPLLGT